MNHLDHDHPHAPVGDTKPDWQAEATKWQAKAEEHLNGWKRAKADYLNLKKDNEKRVEEIITLANVGLLLSLLPILDHLRLALAHIPDDQRPTEWVKGIMNIKKEFDQLFDRINLKPVDMTSFNPEFHEAVAKEKKEGIPSGQILEVLETGYTLGGKLVKPAKVKVVE